MSFIVEDGSGIENANSLVDLEWANEYLSTLGFASDWIDDDEEQRRNRLVLATRHISHSFSWKGSLLRVEQALPFPRRDLKDREGRIITGVPYLIKASTSELAYHLGDNNYITDSELGALKNIRVGPIALSVSDTASETKIIPDSIIRLLSELGSYRFSKTRTRRLVAG